MNIKQICTYEDSLDSIIVVTDSDSLFRVNVSDIPFKKYNA